MEIKARNAFPRSSWLRAIADWILDCALASIMAWSLSSEFLF
jgi:hypothetical protein